MQVNGKCEEDFGKWYSTTSLYVEPKSFTHLCHMPIGIYSRRNVIGTVMRTRRLMHAFEARDTDTRVFQSR